MEADAAVSVVNEAGTSPIVLICDHASNHVPERYGLLGLGPRELESHIAWDPGAAEVARRMARLLDAVLIESRVSRLVVDCNRAADAPDLVPSLSETTIIPGNRDLSEDAIAERLSASHKPFHARLEKLVDARLVAGRTTALVSIHSFTPVYKGVPRPWEIGILHDDDVRLATPMISALKAYGDLTVGDNQPYSPSDRVYYTLARHRTARGLATVMVEIRNNEIASEVGQTRWAERLSALMRSDGPVWHALAEAPQPRA